MLSLGPSFVRAQDKQIFLLVAAQNNLQTESNLEIEESQSMKIHIFSLLDNNNVSHMIFQNNDI